MDLQFDWKSLQREFQLKAFDRATEGSGEGDRRTPEEVAASLKRVLGQGHFLDQWNDVAFKKIECALFAFMNSRWKALLPSKFGVLFRIRETDVDGEATYGAIFTLWNRGSLELYHRPNLTVLAPEKKDQPSHIVRHLSEKHAVPVQMLELERAFWNELCRSQELPWKKLLKEIDEERALLWPSKGSLKSLIWTQAFLGRG